VPTAEAPIGLSPRMHQLRQTIESLQRSAAASALLLQRSSPHGSPEATPAVAVPELAAEPDAGPQHAEVAALQQALEHERAQRSAQQTELRQVADTLSMMREQLDAARAETRQLVDDAAAKHAAFEALRAELAEYKQQQQPPQASPSAWRCPLRHALVAHGHTAAVASSAVQEGSTPPPRDDAAVVRSCRRAGCCVLIRRVQVELKRLVASLATQLEAERGAWGRRPPPPVSRVRGADRRILAETRAAARPAAAVGADAKARPCDVQRDGHALTVAAQLARSAFRPGLDREKKLDQVLAESNKWKVCSPPPPPPRSGPRS
jgi:hypothetical protein